MIRRSVLVLLILCAAAGADARSVLADGWVRVQQSLAAADPELFEQRVREFQEAAGDFGVERLTPYASALTIWAQDHPGRFGRAVVARAGAFDPELPGPYFLTARWQWEAGHYAASARAYLGGWWAVLASRSSAQALGASLGSWILLAIGWTLGVAVVVQVVRYARQMAHDAVELSAGQFRKPNAIVLAVVILGLPLFAGLGPIWLITYLFVLTWAYMDGEQRTTAIVTCCVLALLVPALAAWKGVAFRSPKLATRVATVLEERRLDPMTTRELAALEPQLDTVAPYHLVLGELLRMSGDNDRARLEFQKVALEDDGDPTPLVFLGNLSMEEGDVPRAIQRYDAAIELSPRFALAYHNLSAAYDQIRRFQEGDAARNKARELAGGDTDHLGVRGGDPRLLYPRLDASAVDRLVAEAPDDLLDGTGSTAFASRPLQELLAPTSRVFWIMGAIGLLLLLVRRHWMWRAQVCSKCGKVFCPRCKSATESASYCSQCISVFLKRDLVSIEQQAAKLEQIQRWTAWSTAGRRGLGVLVPGSYHFFDGTAALGVVVGLLAWVPALGAVYWAPRALPAVEPLVELLPVQLALGAVAAVVWVRSAVVAWYRR